MLKFEEFAQGGTYIPFFLKMQYSVNSEEIELYLIVISNTNLSKILK